MGLRVRMFAFALALVLSNNAHAQQAAQILAPEPLPASTQLLNPMSGPISSLAQNAKTLKLVPFSPAYSDPAPLPGTPPSGYGRMSWHSLEPQQGVYDFSIIAQALQPCPAPAGQTLCLPKGGSFSFRIMGLNPTPALDTNVTIGADGYNVYTDIPAYLETPAHGWLLPVDPNDPTQGHYFIPDWNDPFFLARIKALLTALGQQLNGRPQIGWVDIGLYGSWGEWHTSGLPDSADYHGIPYESTQPYYALNTQAYLANKGVPGAYQAGTSDSKNAIIDAHATAFPSTQLAMMTDDGEGLCHALQLPGPSAHIGMKRDSFGSSDWTYQFPATLPDCDTAANQAMILSRWQTAPLIAEPFGNGSSSKFPCQTFETDPTTGAYDIAEQTADFHIAGIRNSSECTGIWSDLSTSEQQAFSAALLKSGYRFAPVEIYVPKFVTPSIDPHITIRAYWTNTGVTPAYNAWRVEYSLWTFETPTVPAQPVARFVSKLDLRTVLPTGSAKIPVEERFDLPRDVTPGTYHLRVQVVDPRGYRLPMQLALQNVTPDGHYWLGPLTIPSFARRLSGHPLPPPLN